MKAYTSLEQSKKLAEILPIESADMWYWKSPTTGFVPEHPMFHKSEHLLNIPAWSLSALINVLPQSIEDEVGTSYALNISKDFVEYYNPSLGALAATYHSVNAVTLVDACVEMIIKLHEQKLL